jgi:hypothetical protein
VTYIHGCKNATFLIWFLSFGLGHNDVVCDICSTPAIQHSDYLSHSPDVEVVALRRGHVHRNAGGTHMYIHTILHTYMYMNINMYIAYIRTYTHTHTHTHMTHRTEWQNAVFNCGV